MKFRYVESCDISQFPWRSYRRVDWSPNPDIVTGTMGVEPFLALKDDIAENGMRHPFIVEFYPEYRVENAGAAVNTTLRRIFAIRTGNNRAEIAMQLDLDPHFPTLLVAPDSIEFPCEGEDIDPADLPKFLSKHWGKSRVWTDCNTLYQEMTK